MALALLMVLLGTACPSSAPEAPPPPDGADDDGFARSTTPEGEAVIELVVEPDEISLRTEETSLVGRETIAIYIVNRGEVEILIGRAFRVQRWNGEEWLNVPSPIIAFPSDGLELPPGKSSIGGNFAGVWPPHWHPDVDSVKQTPGWHRVVKSGHYEDPNHERPAIKLEARTRFLVTS